MALETRDEWQPAGAFMQEPWIRLDEMGKSALSSHWDWALPAGARLLGCSRFGDAFLVAPNGTVHWLNTGTAEVCQVAASLDDFEKALASEASDLWFLPALVRELEASGKTLAEGECYGYAILPVFAEGKYEPWNFKPMPAGQHFEATASLHRQIAGLPDGARVRLAVV
jgi:hypothetical protein